MNSKITNNLKKLAMPFVIATSMVAGQPVMAIAENESLNEVPTYELISDLNTEKLATENTAKEVAEDVVTKAEEVKEETKAEEVKEEAKSEEVKEEAKSEEVKEETKAEEVKEEAKAEEVKEEAKAEEVKEEAKAEEEKEEAVVRNENEVHKVSVITTKVDEEGKPLSGAKLQILNSNGEVVDEWISDGNEHETLLPEGTYTLHEVSAPEGYIVAADKEFTVKVEINEINAGTDHDDSHDVCWHYGGVALYYVESQGQKQEVYCINQGWDEPHGISYDGSVLTTDNIKTFVPDADPDMTDEELLNKILDIIYHRSKASELFPELSESAIRFITEAALKNYTSTKLVEGDGVTLQYRDYRYDPTNSKGFVIDRGNGDAIGQLAKHWYYYHGHQKLPAEYAELFYYLISENDLHPSDMHLYIYSTQNATEDGEKYQNLLGVTWFNPYDEEYVVYLTLMDDKEIIPEIPEEPIVPEEPTTPEKPEEPIAPEEPVKPEEPEEVKIINDTDIPQLGDAVANEMLIALGAGVAGLVVAKKLRKTM